MGCASVAQVERDGVVSLKSVKDAVTDATECVAVMAANNETGVIQPIHEIGEWCSGKGIKFHVDAVQAFGRVDWSWNDLPYDFLSLSAHKLCGPKGVGVLIAKDVDVLHAMIRGGGQEMGFRAGTEPTHMALSMAVAMELAAEEGGPNMRVLEQLKQKMLAALIEGFPELRVLGVVKTLPNTLNVRFPVSRRISYDADGLERICSEYWVCLQYGVCEPSPVIGDGVFGSRSAESVRISMGRFTTEGDVAGFVDQLLQEVAALSAVA